MADPLILEESNCSTPCDSVLLIQNLHWMLRIRQVNIDGRDVIDNNVHGWLHTLLQLTDVEHVITPVKVGGSSKWCATFPSLATMRKKTDVARF
jgi:hypothetical protein